MPKAKTCCKCGGPGPFAKNKSRPDGLQSRCKKCQSETAAASYAKNPKKYLKRTHAYQKAHPTQYKAYDATSKARHPERYMWLKARNRAHRRGISFGIEVTDVIIPVTCPLLEIPLVRGTKKVHPGSPTLDRKVPSLGYVKGNVWVISHRANAVKNDATLEEIELLARNLRRAQGQ
jgi:hypothetical protein